MKHFHYGRKNNRFILLDAICLKISPKNFAVAGIFSFHNQNVFKLEKVFIERFINLNKPLRTQVAILTL